MLSSLKANSASSNETKRLAGSWCAVTCFKRGNKARAWGSSRSCSQDKLAPYKMPACLAGACLATLASEASVAHARNASTPGCASERALADIMACTRSSEGSGARGVCSC